MLIPKIGVMPPLKTSFKSNITFDIGGSQREGSCKIRYSTSVDDKKIYDAKTTVNELDETTFKSTDAFINQIVKKVKTVQDNNRKNVKDMGYTPSENILKSMTIFIPSYTDHLFAYYLPNHRDTEGDSLEDLDFSDMPKRLLQAGVRIDPDMKFTLLQDAMGSGLAIAKKLHEQGMLEKGNNYTACITGGGCGTTNIERLDDENIYIKSTGSGYLPGWDRLGKVSQAGASAPALCRNFCGAFQINPIVINKILSCSKAEFVLNNPVTYKKDVKTERLKKLLLSTGKYELVSEDDKEYTIAVTKEFESEFNTSRKEAIDQYCLAFARFALIKKNECSNGLIITGPLARSINRVAKIHYGKGISEIVKQKLNNFKDTYELNKKEKTYGFDVICDERFSVDDNTACCGLAHEASFVADNRSNLIKIPISSLDKTDENY